MATVSGITVERAQEIEDASIVSGHIDSGSGRLILVNHGGAEINAGLVVPSIPPVVAAWPIGSIFICTTSANPATLLGGGSWSKYAQSRVLLGESHTAGGPVFGGAGDYTLGQTGAFQAKTDSPVDVVPYIVVAMWVRTG